MRCNAEWCTARLSRRHAVIWAMSFLCALTASGQPDYTAAHWVPPACTKYYGSGNGHKFCVIHDMEGYYLTSISYLNRCDTDTNGVLNVQASVNYLVNGLRNGVDEDGNTESLPNDAAPGDITQSVRDANYAWHARCWNTWMYGTEHEGFVTSPLWYTEAMYQASAALQRYLCNKSSIPKDRNHIIGHNEWQNSTWTNWMAANFPGIDTTCNTHTDPGVYWDWNHFIALINSAPGIIRHPWSRVVEPGSNVTFTVSCTNVVGATYQWRKNGVAIAGATAASYTTPATVLGDSGSLFSVVVTGAAAPPATSNNATLTVTPLAGTITVNSVNSVTNQPVPSSWVFLPGSISDPCASLPCNGTAATYSAQLAGGYMLTAVSAGPLYSLKGVESHFASTVDHPGFFTLAFWKNILVKIANAISVGPCVSSNPCGQTLLGSGSIVFTPEWDPVANISAPASIPVTDVAPGTINLSNNGGGGSVLNWSINPASITYSSGSNWLSVSPISGAVLAGAPAQPVTVTYTGSLLAGSYTATVVITGTSAPTGVVVAQKTVTVNLTIATSPLSCVPANQTVNIAQPALITGSGGTLPYSWTAPGGIPAAGAGPSFTVNYGAGAIATSPNQVTVTDSSPTPKTASCAVNVIDLHCSFSATPSQIIVPGKSTLSWVCTPNVVSCSIDNGVGAVVNPQAGSVQVSPAVPTIYTMNCNGTPNATFTANVNVNVVKPGLIEVTPH